MMSRVDDSGRAEWSSVLQSVRDTAHGRARNTERRVGEPVKRAPDKPNTTDVRTRTRPVLRLLARRLQTYQG